MKSNVVRKINAVVALMVVAFIFPGLFGSGIANADEPEDLVNETFDGMTIDSTPNDWGVNASGLSSVTVKEGTDDNRYLHIHDASIQSSQGIKKTFPSSTGELTIEAELRLPAGASAGKENILFYVLDSNNKPAIALIFTPTAITSVRTTSSGTTSSTLVSGLALNAWRHIVIAADYETNTFDFYLNGELKQSGVAFRYDDALNLAKLQVMGANYPDNTSYIRLADLDNVRIYPYLPDSPPVPEPAVPPAPGVEANSFDSYSSVFLSSRWYRQGGEDGGQLGTLDVLKRFMVTDDKWTRETDSTHIGNIIRLGVGFQESLNMNIGTGGRAQDFDGNSIVAPWMVSWGATWGSMSDPVYYQLVLNEGKKGIDAGVTSFHFDDWKGSVAVYDWGGDFSSAALTRFSDYLADTYSVVQLAAWGISDIETFNYKNYLQSTLNIQTNEDYQNHKTESPLDGPFRDFVMEECIRFHQQLHEDLEDYAGHPLEFSLNSSIIGSPQLEKHFLSDLYDYEIGETSEESLSMKNLVTFGTMAAGLGKPQVISPLVQHVDVIRKAIAGAYALGQYVLVPWDIFRENSPRYFGTVEEFGDLYHFIRQYPFLFDGYEAPSKVGILVKWSEMDSTSLSSLSMRLFEAGVPFKDIVANGNLPHYELEASQFTGLDALIAYTPLCDFSTADQAVINNSGIPVIAPQEVDSSWLAGRSSVSISGGDEMFATVRSPEDSNAPKVIHLLNQSGIDAEDVMLTLADTDFFGGSGIHAALYRPGRNPLPLTLSPSGSGKKSLLIPQLEEWGIVRISKDSVPEPGPFAVSAPWSGVDIGNPVRDGSAAVTGNSLTLVSAGEGLNASVYGDSGSSDQLAYVYQNLEATPLQDVTIAAKLLPFNDSPDGSLAGLMVRETPASNAKFVAAAMEKGSGLKLYWRDADNEAVNSVILDEVSLPGYLKLERHAGTYTVYYSADGISWGDPLGAHTSEMSSPLGGAFAAAGTEEGTQTVTFDGLAIDYGGIALPPGQLTSLKLTGLPGTLLFGKTANLSVTAVVYDSGVRTDVDVTYENIDYTSSDTDVAVVSRKGEVIAISAGYTDVTASFTANGTTVTASMTLHVAEQGLLLEETFDSYGDEETLPGWSFKQRGIGSYIKVVPHPSVTDKSLAIYDNTSTDFPSATVDFETQSGPVTIDMDFQADFGADPLTGGAIVSYVQDANGTNAISLLADANGFWYLDGTTSVTAAPIIEGEWYHIRIVAYPDTQKMDLYIDGTEVVHQGNFRNSTGTVSKLLVGGSTSGVDTTIYWNNLQITAGVPDFVSP